MKRSPNEQLVALLEGLNLPNIIPGKSMLAHLQSSPKELKEAGMTVSRLAAIGLETVDKTWQEGHGERAPENPPGQN